MKKLPARNGFFVLCGVSLLLWFRPLSDALSLAIRDDQYTQILLVLPISAALIIRGWGRLSSEAVAWPPAAGLFGLILAVEAWMRWEKLATKPDVLLAIGMTGVVGWWIASFAFCFGLRAARSFRFPLLFLFWLVPIPGLVLNQIIAELQRGSAFAAQLLFTMAAVPVSREGTVLSIPGLNLEVAAECSSIRSSLMLVVTAMLLAHVLLKSPWRKLLIVALALPLSIAKNGMRIFTIAMLSTRVDPAFLHGRLHRNGGILFFLVALAVISLSIRILQRGEEQISIDEKPGAILSSARVCS